MKSNEREMSRLGKVWMQSVKESWNEHRLRLHRRSAPMGSQRAALRDTGVRLRLPAGWHAVTLVRKTDFIANTGKAQEACQRADLIIVQGNLTRRILAAIQALARPR